MPNGSQPLLCFPSAFPPELARALDGVGYTYRCASGIDQVEGAENGDGPDDGWLGAVVVGTTDIAAAVAFCRHFRLREVPLAPLLLIIGPEQFNELTLRDELYDDFCLFPATAEEFTARLAHLLWRHGGGLTPELIEYGPLVLNLETYQAAIAGRVLDLTYMEYELLRFLASHPAKVFTRDTLLSRVWGYEYYGGARTVDVHVRRLRAKLGEEHAHLIQTVRSVGYRFGQTGWIPQAR